MPLVSPIKTEAPVILARKVHPIVFVFLGLMILAGVFAAGFFYADKYDQQQGKNLQLAEETLELSEIARYQLLDRLAREQQGSKVTQSAGLETKRFIKELETRNQALKKEIDVLKTLVSGDVRKLALSKAAFTPIVDGQADYSIKLTKLSSDKYRVEGTFSVNLKGLREGKSVLLTAKELGAKVHKMGFRRFQDFKGKVSIPAGVEAQSWLVTVNPRGRGFKSFDQVVDLGTN